MRLWTMLAVVAAVCVFCGPGFAQGPGISTEIPPPAPGLPVGSCAGPHCAAPGSGRVIWVGPPVYGPPTAWVPAPIPGPAYPCRYPGQCPPAMAPAYWPGHPHGHGLPHPPAAYHYDARSRRSVGLSLRLDWTGRDRIRDSGFGHQ